MGDVIDIHGGGRDLVFPHHENELAQSRAAAGPCCGCGSAGHQHGGGERHAARDGGGGSSAGGSGGEDQHDNATAQSSGVSGEHRGGVPVGSSSGGGSEDQDQQQRGDPDEFVRFWLHNGFVNVDSEKMSKSLGNFFTIREAVAKYHALALRWFLVSTHYRQQVNETAACHLLTTCRTASWGGRRLAAGHRGWPRTHRHLPPRPRSTTLSARSKRRPTGCTTSTSRRWTSGARSMRRCE
jgi:hypothetical protein